MNFKLNINLLQHFTYHDEFNQPVQCFYEERCILSPLAGWFCLICHGDMSARLVSQHGSRAGSLPCIANLCFTYSGLCKSADSLPESVRLPGQLASYNQLAVRYVSMQYNYLASNFSHCFRTPFVSWPTYRIRNELTCLSIVLFATSMNNLGAHH